MKRIILLALLGMHIIRAYAQTEVYDIVKHMPPSGFTKEITESAVLYSKIDGSTWCQLAVYKSTSSKGSIEADSKSEWEKIVVPSRTISREETTKPESKNGWTVMSRSGVWQFNGTNVSSILTTWSNKKICVSILCNTTAKPYLEDRKKFMDGVVLNTANVTLPPLNIPPSTYTLPPTNTAQPANASKPSVINTIIGEWNENIFERMGTQFTAGYFQKQYTFNSDGTYQFLQKNWSAYVPSIIFVQETGKWAVNGNTLTITPLKSTGQEWSKSASGRSNEWGKLIKTQTRKLENNTYTFGLKYYSGSQSGTLELLSSKSTEREPIPANAAMPYKSVYSLNTQSPLIAFPPGTNP